jgi:mannose-6-phosphate isomerase-like protein (cupin superfamily)
MSLNHRQHRDTPRVSNGAKVNSVWDDAESHEGNYDFYVIVGGTGEVVVDGPMENNIRINSLDVPGEFRGQPIANGTTYRVKEGDWLLIPPNVPHWPKPDAGGMSYLRMVIYTTPQQ